MLCAREEGDMLEVLGRIGLEVCLCGYAAIVLWVWGWDKRKDRRERRHGESSDKTGAVQQGNVSGAESGAGEEEELLLNVSRNIYTGKYQLYAITSSK